MSDPERIWLQNADDARATGDRLWCQDKVWPECDEQQEPTEYIRADLYASRISQQDAELERMRREVEALRVLSFSGNALVQIVEGVQGSMEHGTWRDEKGMRLKDTNAWALFYTTFKASAEAAKGVQK